MPRSKESTSRWNASGHRAPVLQEEKDCCDTPAIARREDNSGGTFVGTLRSNLRRPTSMAKPYNRSCISSSRSLGDWTTGVVPTWGKLATMQGDGEYVSDAEAERVRRELQQLVKRVGTQVDAAALLGYSQQQLSIVLRRRRRVTVAFARALARCLGIGLSDLLDGPQEFVPLTVSKSARAPTLAQAVAMHPGRWSLATVQAVEAGKSREGAEWEALLDAAEMIRRQGH